MQDEYKDSEQSVIASDFYYANTIMHLSDEAIVNKVKSNLDRCEPDFRNTTVEDYAVLRFPKAVTHFSPGSYKNRPFQVWGGCNIPTSVAHVTVHCSLVYVTSGDVVHGAGSSKHSTIVADVLALRCTVPFC